MTGGEIEPEPRQTAYYAGKARLSLLRSETFWSGLTAIVLLTAYAFFGFSRLSPWAAAWDEVDFALALHRFDLLAMQPHAPGYPYFILGGRFMRFFAVDPVKALGLWNLTLAVASAWPLYALASRWLRPWYAWLAALLVLTVPLSWTFALRPMSEGAALALLWWYLWTLARAAERRTTRSWIAAAFVFGLLMGTRLSYFPFGFGLFLLWLPFGKNRATWTAAIGMVAAAAAFQAVWLAGLAATEGGLRGFSVLMEAFAAGHFGSWGGGVAADPMPLHERFIRFLWDNLLNGALFARTAVLGALFVCLAAAAGAACFIGFRARRSESVRTGIWSMLRMPGTVLLLGSAAYLLWGLLGQNIAKPRHAAPIADLLLFGLAVLAMRPGTKVVRIAGTAVAVALLAGQAAVGGSLATKQRDEEPAVYQLADWLSDAARKSGGGHETTVYTWEEERVLRYLHVPVTTRAIFTYDYFRAEAEADPERRILLTGAVVDGFRQQLADRGETESLDVIGPIAVFRSDERLDPVYGTISLWEWSTGKGEEKR